MTLTLTALLCLGLCQGPWDLVQAGDLPKPTIRADPSPMVTLGSPVTIWCQGSLQADAYRLYKEGGSGPSAKKTLEESSNRTGFSIESSSSSTAGRYQCAYHISGNSWSEWSDLLPLTVTGLYGAPSLSAYPSPVVASGENLSLLCSSEFTSGTFHLLKEGGADPLLQVESKLQPNTGRWQALFPMGPASTSHGGTYRCYGSHSSFVYEWSEPSDLLRLEVTASLPQDYTLGNLIRMVVAALILLVLGVLLFQARPRLRGPREQQEDNTEGNKPTFQ
ncbi:leukocyte immunoglobulin-like receptor subfamily A member 5 [Pteropus vampyrus]|uniref:Leukocyte immunoglobulin-like receptor subfamily A member 5 n=1 Tax=Pteropus vampyrus TaxID=132908 RepID=A0A6P3R9D6_PTEVA|nr:leukocyte immunoglobulin-like receptor subfamily A member 5 [Pteropus vampyrus]